MMIPLRRTLIVARHGELKYPEGTACAEVLKAAELSKSEPQGAATADSSRAGYLPGIRDRLLYKTVNIALKGWKDVPEKVFGAPLKGGSVGVEISPNCSAWATSSARASPRSCARAGPRVSPAYSAHQVLRRRVSVPLAPGAKLIHDMSPNQIRGAYVLYIGAGAVAAGGVVSLAKALPTIWSSLGGSLKGYGGGTSVDKTTGRRTTRTSR